MFVQNGTITANENTTTVNLSTPVEVGKSFAWVTRAGVSASTLCTAELATVVDGFYTQLIVKCEGGSAQRRSWFVVSGANFTVQTGETEITGTSATAAISAVTLSKSFIVSTIRKDATAEVNSTDRYFTRCHFNSTTQLGFNRQGSTGSMFIRWYAIQWEGATVASLTNDTMFSSGGTTGDRTITEVDLDKTFVIMTYMPTELNDGRAIRELSRVRLTSSTNLQYERAGGLVSANQPRADVFIVSHPDISVQSGNTAYTGTTQNQSISGVTLSRAMLPSGYLGNTMATQEASDGNWGLHQVSHRFTSTTNIQFERFSSASGTSTTSWFAVTFNAEFTAEDEVSTDDDHEFKFNSFTAEDTIITTDIELFQPGDLKKYFINGIETVEGVTQLPVGEEIPYPVKLFPTMSSIKSIKIIGVPSTGTLTGETIATLKFYANQSTTPFLTKIIRDTDWDKGYIHEDLNKHYAHAFQMSITYPNKILDTRDFRPSRAILEVVPTNAKG